MPPFTQQKLGTAELLFKRASVLGLNPRWVMPNTVFVIDTIDGEQYVNQQLSNINSHISTSLAKNKFITRLILERNHLPNIPFAKPTSHDDALAFLREHETIIVKPLSGSGSNNIHVVTNKQQLLLLDIDNTIIEKYIAGIELRYLVLNNSVIGVHESSYGESVQEDRDLERISYESKDWDSNLIKISLDICAILGLSFAAVDFLIDNQDNVYVLEVNSCPGFKWFHAPSAGPPIDVASQFLDAIIKQNQVRLRQVLAQ